MRLFKNWVHFTSSSLSICVTHSHHDTHWGEGPTVTPESKWGLLGATSTLPSSLHFRKTECIGAKAGLQAGLEGFPFRTSSSPCPPPHPLSTVTFLQIILQITCKLGSFSYILIWQHSSYSCERFKCPRTRPSFESIIKNACKYLHKQNRETIGAFFSLYS